MNARVDRASELAQRFAVKKASIVVLDAGGDEVARFEVCTDVPSVLAVMKRAVSLTRAAKEKSAELAPRVAKAEALLEQGDVRECSKLVARALREKRIVRALRERCDALAAKLAERAAPRLDEARAKDESGDAGGAWLAFRSVRDDFEGLAAAEQAKAAMTALERVAEKKPLIREAMAGDALSRARALAAQGKRDEARAECWRIAAEFDGTRAATEAKDFAKELSAKRSPGGMDGDAAH